MKKTRSFDTEDILAQAQKGVDVSLGKLSVKDVGYLRSWADTKGLFVSKVGDSIFVYNRKKSSLRGYIMAGILTGKVPFSVGNANEKTVRYFVSRHNVKNKETPWCVMKKGAKEFLIYPQPAAVNDTLV